MQNGLPHGAGLSVAIFDQAGAGPCSGGKVKDLKQLIEEGREVVWYNSSAWMHMREQVLHYDNYECQHCKERGRYRKAKIVHHVKHLKDRPDLALSLFDPDTGERQLVSLCRACHEAEHPERAIQPRKRERAPITAERWD